MRGMLAHVLVRFIHSLTRLIEGRAPSSPSPLTDQPPEAVVLVGRRDGEVAHVLGQEKALAGRIEKSDSTPASRRDRPGQPLERAELHFVVRLFRPRGILLVPQGAR